MFYLQCGFMDAHYSGTGIGHCSVTFSPTWTAHRNFWGIAFFLWGLELPCVSSGSKTVLFEFPAGSQEKLLGLMLWALGAAGFVSHPAGLGMDFVQGWPGTSVCVSVLNALSGLPLSCWDPFDAPHLFRELSSGWSRSLVPVSWWGSWDVWRAGHEHRLPAQMWDRKRRKERERKWKEQEKNLLLLNLRASRAFVEQPGLVTSPRSHQPRAKDPWTDSDNSIYFLGQRRPFPLLRVASWSRGIVATKCLWLEVFGCEEKPAGEWDTRAVLAVQGSPPCRCCVEGRLTDVPPRNDPFCFLSFKGKAALLLSNNSGTSSRMSFPMKFCLGNLWD